MSRVRIVFIGALGLVLLWASPFACKGASLPNLGPLVACVLQHDTDPPAKIALECGDIAVADVIQILAEQRKLEARRYACTPDAGSASASRDASTDAADAR
jgi:hypothetical protein